MNVQETPLEMEQSFDGEWYFGDKCSSDAIIELVPWEEQSCKQQEDSNDMDDMEKEDGSAQYFLHTHTKVLRGRAQFFAARLDCDETSTLRGKLHLKLKMVKPLDGASYRACIDLMYHKYLCTSDFLDQPELERIFDIVEVALQIGFQACVDKVLEFFSGISWSRDQAYTIKAFLHKNELVPRDDMLYRLLGAKMYRVYETHLKSHDPADFWQWYDVHSDHTRTGYFALAGQRDCYMAKDRNRCLIVESELREKLYTEWFLQLDGVKHGGNVDEWVKIFHLLLDANIADYAFECIASDELLPSKLNMKSKMVKTLFERIVRMLNRNNVVLLENGVFTNLFEDLLVVPRSLLCKICETWGMKVTKTNRKCYRFFNELIVQLNPDDRSRVKLS